LCQLRRHPRLAHANPASAAVLVAITIEQALVPLALVAATITMELCEQAGVLPRYLVGLTHLALEQVRIEGQAQVRLRITPGRRLPNRVREAARGPKPHVGARRHQEEGADYRKRPFAAHRLLRRPL